jgi:hypothetical protein
MWEILTEERGMSGTVTLTIDGKEIDVDDVPITFSLDGSMIDRTSIEKGRFSFGSATGYGLQYITFSLEPSTWGGERRTIHFEINAFCIYDRMLTKYSIHIDIDTGTIELKNTIEEQDSNRTFTTSVASRKAPVDPSGMTVSVSIGP